MSDSASMLTTCLPGCSSLPDLPYLEYISKSLCLFKQVFTGTFTINKSDIPSQLIVATESMDKARYSLCSAIALTEHK